MIIASPTCANRPGKRRAFVGFLLLFFLCVLILGGVLSLNVWLLFTSKIQQQNSTDAADLAATAILADDILLFGDETQIYDGVSPDLLSTSIATAIQYATYNYVGGAAFVVQNDDVTFGTVDIATKTFTAIDYKTATPAQLRSINAVRVVGLRTVARNNALYLFGGNFFGGKGIAQVVTQATAALDRYVIGFKAEDLQIVPMVPIAIYSDYNTKPAPSWEFQVENFATPVSGPLPYGTMTVNIGYPGYLGGNDNAALLQIGTANVAALITQVTGGITPADLTTFGVPLELDATTNQILINELPGPLPATADFTSLKAALDTLQANNTAMVWPLFTGRDGMTTQPIVTQFVTARVTNVVIASAGGQNYISVTLTPALIQTPTAVTDVSRNATFGPRPLENRYVCRVRLTD